MLTKEQIESLIEAAKADDAAEKLGALAGTMIQAAADVVVAEELKGIKANRDEIHSDLLKWKPFGKPEELAAQIEELKVLRAAKGKKPDQKELDELVAKATEDRVATFRAEQEALRQGIEEERDSQTATAEKLLATLLEAKRREVIMQHAQGLKPLMAPFYEKRIGPMLQPVESDNGEPWWSKDVVSWKVMNPQTGAPLTGKGGVKTPGELIEDGRLGLGDQDWNSKEFAETFFEPKGKGGGYTAPGEIPTTPSTHVDPSAPSYVHAEALFGPE